MTSGSPFREVCRSKLTKPLHLVVLGDLLDEKILQIETNLTTVTLCADEGTVVKGAENILRYIL